MQALYLRRVILAIVVLGAQVGSSVAVAAIRYEVNFDGTNLDLSGFIDLTEPVVSGSVKPSAFDALIESYSITASNNGSSSFVFTPLNSDFGGFGFGALVDIIITPNQILLDTSFDDTVNNIFLINGGGGAPNLQYRPVNADTSRLLFAPTPPGTVISEDFGRNSNFQFQLAAVASAPSVLEPSSAAMFGLVLAALPAFGRLRRLAPAQVGMMCV